MSFVTGLLINKPVFFLGLLSIGLALSYWMPLPIIAAFLGVLFRLGAVQCPLPDVSWMIVVYCLLVGVRVSGHPINLIRGKLQKFFMYGSGIVLALGVITAAVFFFRPQLDSQFVQKAILILWGCGFVSWPALMRVLSSRKAEGPLTTAVQGISAYVLLATACVFIGYVFFQQPPLEMLKNILVSGFGALLTVGSVALAVRRAERPVIAVLIMLGMLWSWIAIFPGSMYFAALLVGLGLRWVPQIGKTLNENDWLEIIDALAMFLLVVLAVYETQVLMIGLLVVVTQYSLGWLVLSVLGKLSGFVDSVYPRLGGMLWRQLAVPVFMIMVLFPEQASFWATLWLTVIVLQIPIHHLVASFLLKRAGEANV